MTMYGRNTTTPMAALSAEEARRRAGAEADDDERRAIRELDEARARAVEVPSDPDRPVHYSPEIGNPVGWGARWPAWLLGLALLVLIAFVVWTQAAR